MQTFKSDTVPPNRIGPRSLSEIKMNLVRMEVTEKRGIPYTNISHVAMRVHLFV